MGTPTMMTCKHVSTLFSTGAVAAAPLTVRLGVRLHLLMCRHCRAFKRQIEALGRAAHRASAAFDEEPSQEFEAHVTQRLRDR